MSRGPFHAPRTWDIALTDTCTISTTNTALSGFNVGLGIGGDDSVSTTTNVPCRLQHDSTGESSSHMRDESTDGYTLYLSDRHNILAGDQITMLYKGVSTKFDVEGTATASGIGSGIRKVFLSRVIK